MAPPMQDSSRELTVLLQDWMEGDTDALHPVVDALYGDFRKLAGAYLRGERSDHTLQPTALANEAFIKLLEVKRLHFRDREHFLALAARFMRRLLVDHARKHQAEKRRALAIAVSLEEAAEAPDEPAELNVEILGLHEALQALEALDPRQSRVVELRHFGGLTLEETAALLGVSPATVKVDWKLARAFLFRRLHGG